MAMSKWAAIAEAAKQKTWSVQKVQKGAESDFLTLSDLSAPGSLSEIGVSEAKIGPNGLPGSKPEKSADHRPPVLPAVSSPQTPQDWRDYFAERAAIAEFDGGLSRPEAEAQTWECCLSSWLNTNPSPETSDGVCAQCGGHLGDHDSVPIARPVSGT